MLRPLTSTLIGAGLAGLTVQCSGSDAWLRPVALASQPGRSGMSVEKCDLRFSASAESKLMLLDAAGCLNELKLPSGNHLEALQADRKGQDSIRINSQ